MTIHHRVFGLRFDSGSDPGGRAGARLATDLIVAASWGCPHLERHAYPGQPATRTRPPVQPCTCIYYRAQSVFTHISTRSGGLIPLYGLPGISWFEIDRACPHHSELAVSIEELWNDPALNVLRDPYDLDDNERRD